ncbi:MAG: triosephosphate isomerase [Candidatus Hepatoplasma scabrum]|nr:MAG: triosephosphate isomerase [Candidatus Hepatoplasma sp.]
MKRRKIIIGNWKMYNGPENGHIFLHKLEHKLHNQKINCDFAIAATFVTLPYIMPHDHGNNKGIEIDLCAQNFHYQDEGPFTGEVSLPMLEQLGVRYGIVGHSERRQYFNETNKTVNLKVKAALNSSIIPILAFGESLAEFEKNKTNDVIEKQLKEGLAGISKGQIERVILAYEPIWAIGTGKTATPKQAQDTIKKAREIVADIYDLKIAEKIRIQYGGSVKPENIKELMKQKDIDGALVGGASLDPDSFFKLITYDQD